MEKLTHFSLCTGIGGIDLAAEWAGFKTVGQCELAEYPYNVLCNHWPDVPKWRDIRDVSITNVRNRGIKRIDILSAGFPCQPYSIAGKGLGDCDERDLWGEVARCIREFRPKWFVGENTPGLLKRKNGRYFRRILDDLSRMGYMVSWGMWGACHVGAPHIRERIFIIANTTSSRRRGIFKNKSNRCVREYIQIQQKWSPETLNTLIGLSRKIPEPNSRVLRNDNGIPEALDRIKCLGNAVVPQQAYQIFKAIYDIEKTKESIL